MENNEEKDYEVDYKVDVKQTFYANFMWLWMTGIVIIFIIMGFTQINVFKDETTRLLYLIVMLFVTVRLFSWMGGPHLRLREKRDGEK